jgi:hypothetical protein
MREEEKRREKKRKRERKEKNVINLLTNTTDSLINS